MDQLAFKRMMFDHKELQKELFIRGFLVSNESIGVNDDFPYYGNWSEENYGGFYFAFHSLTSKHFFVAEDGTVHFILGHAYDPFSMEYHEGEILKNLSAVHGTDAYMDLINDLTGVFVIGNIKEGSITYLTDPSGMQFTACGIVNDRFYLTSHPQLVADLCGLTMSSFVKELTNYKWYRRVMGAYLPADLTAFENIKRVVPSILYQFKDTISHKRFWPLTEIDESEGEKYEEVIRKAAAILKNNMQLISQKWEKPWISLTGGIDSNTTFAAANGYYEYYETFSYVSAPKEAPDAEAARIISDSFGVKHHQYDMLDKTYDDNNYELIAEVLRHNNGYVAERRDNETRKRILLKNNMQGQVEVKSWTSETIRAYWYKHYARKSMPKLSPKLYRNLYKIFITNRSLARKVDILFADYLNEYQYYDIPECFLPADIHFNEVTWGSWGGTNINEMKYICDLTVPYNNRRLLELMFQVPLKKRIDDTHHLDMKKVLNKKLYDMHIRVVNKEETRLRAFLLNIIFTINSILPF